MNRSDSLAKNHAVLTGDLVSSRDLSDSSFEGLVASFHEGLGVFTRRFQAARLIGPDLFRGDSWQLVVEPSHLALRLALWVRAWLRSRHGRDTRISLAIGEVGRLVEHRVTESSGPAFELSGKGLDGLREPVRLCLSFSLSQPPLPAVESSLIVRMLDRIVGSWTDREALAVSGALLGETQTKMAQGRGDVAPGTSRQAIGSALVRADWPLVELVLNWFEEGIAI